MNIKNSFRIFYGDLKQSVLDLSVIILIISFFQFVVLQKVPENIGEMVLGLSLVAIGLALFLRGLEVGIFPLGEDLSKQLAHMPTRFFILLFAFVIGFATTIAEPALIAIANKAAVISAGGVDALTLRIVVAFSVGLAIFVGVIRIITDHPIHWYIIGGYVMVLTMTYFSPEEIVGLAYDSGGITTSTVTVPLIAALGIGLASSLKSRNPLIDGFGLIAFASVFPMIFVQGYGIIAYSIGNDEVVAINETVNQGTQGIYWKYFMTLVSSIRDVTPVVIVILSFYWGVLRKSIHNLGVRASGFGLVILGLYFFVIGLEMGLFPIGETLSISLANTQNILLIYSFSFAIGFATTVAEPALTAIARKAEEISDGSIRQGLLRAFVSFGVGIGILLGAYRIVQGDSIVYYIMSGYILVIIMTFLAPKTIVPIAYDSGGVTTSTITVPIVAALGLGLATTIPGRDPLIDGFGLIAFASLFPMIAVLGYGIVKRESIRLHERQIIRLEKQVLNNMVRHLDKNGEDDIAEEKAFLSQLNIKRKKIITICGQSGSGVSTITNILASSLEYRKFNAGALFRNIAQQHNMTIEELNEYAKNNTNIDREIDTLIRQIGEGREVVLDTRLGYYWIHDSFRVFLKVDPHVAASRIFDELCSKDQEKANSSSIEEIMESSKELDKTTQERYFETYGINIENTNTFDLIIDTSDKSTKEIVDLLKTKYREWLQKKL